MGRRWLLFAQEMKQVAEALNIGIATLYRKVKKYNIK